MQDIIQEAQSKIQEADSLSALEDLRIAYLGKSGILTKLASQIKDIPNDKKKQFGQEVNTTKDRLQELLSAKLNHIEQELFLKTIAADKLDLTLTPRRRSIGKIHPISQTIEELSTIFASLGFAIAQGPSIETQWHNFVALNIDENHPARQMHDTFYLNSLDKEDKSLLLRTHTSPVQIRAMLQGAPPFKFICFGRTYRADSDMTHTPMFHQMEAMVVDKKIDMGQLKWLLVEVIRLFFENDKVEVRMRPSFFPFTQPSAEIDIRMPGNDKWLEVLGSGMVHPKVLENANIDSSQYSGLALGLGIERFAMLKYGIGDLRQFFDPNLNWLRHFGFLAFHKISLEGSLSV